MADSWRILGGTSASSRRNLGKFSAELRQVLGRNLGKYSADIKTSKGCREDTPKGSQDAQKASKRVPKGVQRHPKTTKNESVFPNRFRMRPRLLAPTFCVLFWLHFGSILGAKIVNFSCYFLASLLDAFLEWPHFWCHFGRYWEVVLGTFPDFLKNGAPHASAVNSNWIEGRALRKSTTNLQKQKKNSRKTQTKKSWMLG